MKKAFKTAFLYIGTAIGAGFSSGREIMLFFGKSSPLNVALASVFMSALCCLFLFAGKLRLMPKGRIVRFMVFFSAGISLTSMLAGGEYVLSSLTGVPMLGLVMAILGAVIVTLGIEKIRLLNAALVPLIVLSIAVIFIKLDGVYYDLPFSIAKPVLYSGLDVLLGGVVIAEEGENLSVKEIFLSCAVICASLFVMLFMLQSVVLCDEMSSSMPVLAVSQKFGLKPICGVLIAAAIFTTLVSSLRIVSESVIKVVASVKRLSVAASGKYKAFWVFFTLLIAYPISFVGFDNVVNTMYPVMSWCGVALTALTAAKMLARGALALLRSIRSIKERHSQVVAPSERQRRTARKDKTQQRHDTPYARQKRGKLRARQRKTELAAPKKKRTALRPFGI